MARLETEQSDPRYRHLDEMSVVEIVATMNDADQTVPAAIRRSLPRIAEAIEAAEPRFAAGGRLIYLGAGTSGRLGVLDAAECPPTFHTDPHRVVGLIAGGYRALVDAVEGAEDDAAGGAADVERELVTAGDIVVGLSASGRTPYVLGGLRRARELGALSVALSCNSPAELTTVAEHAIELPVGPEVLAGSTRLKAGSAQKQVLNMISTALMVRTGRTYGNLMVEVQATNSKLRQRSIDMVARLAGADPKDAERAFVDADREVKTAVVMVMQRLTAESARERLAAVEGRLGDAIGLPSSRHPALN
ncbi:MAG: N-acetylmuramic acid 6-phosphate etherase [Propionibacteriaceae bacterium]